MTTNSNLLRRSEASMTPPSWARFSGRESLYRTVCRPGASSGDYPVCRAGTIARIGRIGVRANAAAASGLDSEQVSGEGDDFGGGSGGLELQREIDHEKSLWLSDRNSDQNRVVS